MPGGSNENLGQREQEFNDELNKALEGLHGQNPDILRPEDLQQAGLITQEIREMIEEKFPGSVLQFQSIVARKRAELGDLNAFKFAFREVYGAFLFKQKNEVLEAKDGRVMKTIRTVARFELDDDEGINGHPELESGVRKWLHLVSSSAGEDGRSAEQIREIEGNLAERQGQHTDLYGRAQSLNQVGDAVNDLDITTDISSILGDIAEIEAVQSDAHSILNFLLVDQDTNLPAEMQEARANLEPYVENVMALRERLEQFHTALMVYNFGAETLHHVQAFLLMLDVLLISPRLSAEAWKRFLSQDFAQFIEFLENSQEGNQLFLNHVLAGSFEDIRERYQYLSDNTAIVDDYEHLYGEAQENGQFISETQASIQDNQDFFQERAADFFDRMNVVQTRAQELADSEMAQLVPGLTGRCNQYLAAYNQLIAGGADTVTAAQIIQFVEEHYVSFMNEVEAMVTRTMMRSAEELGQLEDSISELEVELARLQSYGGSRINENIQREIAEVQEKLDEANSRKDSEQPIVAAFDRLIQHLRTGNESLDDIDSLIAAQGRKDELQTTVAGLEQEIPDLEAQIEQLVKDHPELNTLSSLTPAQIVALPTDDIERMKGLMNNVEFSRKLLGFKPNTTVDMVKLDRRYQRLLAEYDPVKANPHDGTVFQVQKLRELFERAYNKLKDAIEDPANTENSLGPIPDPVGELQRLRGRLKARQLNLARLQGQLADFDANRPIDRDAIFEALDGFRDQIVIIRGDGALPQEIRDRCQRFLDAYAQLEAERRNPNAPSELFANFVTNTLRPFAQNLWRELSDARSPHQRALDQALTDVARLQHRLDNLNEETAVTRILKKAFPGLEFEGDTLKIRGFETNFDHVAKKLKEAEEYFGSPANVPTLREGYRNLNNLVDRSSLDFEVGINSQINKLEQEIDSKKRNLTRDPNATELIKAKAQLRNVHSNLDEAALHKKVLEPYKKARDEENEQIAKDSDKLTELKDIKEQSKTLYDEMKKMMTHLEIAHKAGIKLKVGDAEVPVEQILNDFGAIDLRSNDFNPRELLDIYVAFNNYLASDTLVAGLKNMIKKARTDIEKNTYLKDSEIARKIIGAIVAEQFPNMSQQDRDNLVTNILKKDLGIIHTADSYEELSKKSTAELMDTVNQAGFKQKLLGFRFEADGEVVQPFKKIKAELFASWESINNMFEIGTLNDENGFYALAGFKYFSREGDAPQQADKIADKLKTMIASKLIEEATGEAVDADTLNFSMLDSGMVKIVEDTFNERLAKANEMFKAYSNHYDRNVAEWNEYKAAELSLRLEKLNEEYRLGKINWMLYQKRYADIMEEAEEQDVNKRQIDFFQNSVITGFWNSPHSQWLRDRGAEVGKYAGKKVLAVYKSGFKLGFKGAWGATKIGAGLAGQAVLTPFRAAKLGLMIGGKLPIGIINLFRRQAWQPYSVINQVKEYKDRALGYVKEEKDATVAGAKEAITTIPKADWQAVSYERKDYKDKTKKDTGVLESSAEEFKKKGDVTGIKVAKSPLGSYDKSIKRVKALNQIFKKGGEQPMAQAA